jgi:5-methylcytosine-specific restriction endonuclease McrA
MHRVLVLNATYEPLSIISVQRAIVLLLKEKAELIEAAEERLHASRMSLPVPLVIRLVYYVRIPRQVTLSPTRYTVLLRDNFTCQYCGSAPGRVNLTLDHILPRSRGGQTSWDNVVAACKPCNVRKGDRTPEEAAMVLRKRPGRPHYLAFVLLAQAGMSQTVMRDVWGKYIFLGAEA